MFQPIRWIFGPIYRIRSRVPEPDETHPRFELQVEDRLSDPPFRCICWVVVVNRPDPIYIGGPAPVGGISRDDFLVEETYRFDLIDAYTGEYLFGVEGAVGRAVPSSQNPD